ncbi:MAG: hypothetical protein WAM66_01740 [Acidobacteriaceae bacterium]
MTAPVAPPVDRFWHLTSTAWTAISSLVAAASVIALVVFNWRYLHWTHELSNSASEQAAIARNSLKKLEEQISSELAAQRHAAMAVLREIMSRVTISAEDFRTDLRSEQNPFRLIPDDWNILDAFVSRHLPESSSTVAAASSGLHIVEAELNRLLTVPLNQRGPNSSLSVRYKSLYTNLDNIRKQLNDINAAFAKQNQPKK